MCSLKRTLQRVVLVVVVLAAGTAAALAQQKAPAPDGVALSRAQGLLCEVYGKEYDEAKTSEEKTALAKKMLGQAAKSKGDPASHFALLRVAKGVAAAAGDVETAFEAVGQMAATYDVDAMEMKEKTFRAVASAARMTSQFKAIAQRTRALVDEAVAFDDYAKAVRFGELGATLARRARDYALVKQIVERRKEVEELAEAYAEVQKAREVLETSPTDPEANLAVGRYLCLAKGDWEKGIAMLALGSDAELKALAIRELEGAASADEEMALGDGWWDLAQTRAGKEKESLLLRAGSWYRPAQPSVAGLMKVKIDRRLEEIGRMRPDTPTQPLLPNGWVIGRPVNLGPTVNSSREDGGPVLSSDGLTLLFHSYRSGGEGRADLWMCRRAALNKPFGRPVNLGPTVNSSSIDVWPALSADGLTLFFTSDRPGGQGKLDLWMAQIEH